MGKISTAGSLQKKRKRESTRTKNNKSLASRKVNVARQSNETNWNFLKHPEKSKRKLQPSTVNGAIIYDVSRKPWRLGDQIGKGSFGQIFLASNNITEPVSNANTKYVVKVEPHSNGYRLQACSRFKSYIAETLSAIVESQIVLIDFGLSTKYMSNGAHRPFIMDERRGPDGTLEFTSRDAHMGAHSRRSDLECLGYNFIYWSQGYLPWEDAAKNRQPKKVHHAKELLMTDVRKMIKEIYGNQVPKFLCEFLHQVNQLAFSERPDYAGCRKIFDVEFQKMGYSIPNMRLYPHEILRTNEHISEKNRQNGKRLDIMKKVSEAVLPRLRSRSPKKSVTTKTFSNVEILKNPDGIAQERVARELAREKELNDIQQPILRRYDGQPTYAILELQQRTESKRQLYHKARKEYQEGLNKAGDKRLSGGRKRVVKAPGIRARNGWKSINKSKRVSHTRLNLNRNYGTKASNIQLFTGNALQDTNDSGDSFGTIEE